MSAGAWRVVCLDDVREVEAAPPTGNPRDGSFAVEWRAYLPGDDDGYFTMGMTALAAVACMAAKERWPVVEILAPGEPSRAELVARAKSAADALGRSLTAAEAAREAWEREVYAELREAEAERDYWREQATGAAPSVDAMREITSLLIPGGTGCVIDAERVVAAVRENRAAHEQLDRVATRQAGEFFESAHALYVERDALRTRAEAAEAEVARLRAIINAQESSPSIALDSAALAIATGARADERTRAASICDAAAERWRKRTAATDAERDVLRARANEAAALAAEIRGGGVTTTGGDQ